jgi:hypothetical protein
MIFGQKQETAIENWSHQLRNRVNKLPCSCLPIKYMNSESTVIHACIVALDSTLISIAKLNNVH